VLTHPGFLAGEVSTAFLDELPAPAADEPGDGTGPTTAAALALAERAGAARTVQRGLPVAWRNVPSQPQRTEFESGTVEWWGGRSGYRVDGVEVVSVATDRVTLEHDGLRTSYDVTVVGDQVDVDWPGGHLALRRVPRFTDPADAVASGSLLAPMPGTVVQVAVEAGQQVEAGQPVLVLEAMKMQHTVSAPYAGTVAEISVEAGSQVAAGEVLAVVEEA
jgi:propionyl-CoA carboxylase alpha chain